MSVNFGTYEGHRILSDAATKLADRVQKGYQFKQTNELDERKRRDYAERMRHQNILTDAQAQHEGERQLKTEQEWMKIQTMTPAEYANVRSTTRERDTLVDPRVRHFDATSENLISQARARDEEERRYRESQTVNVESQTRERDDLLGPKIAHTEATTEGIESRTEAQDLANQTSQHNFGRQILDEERADTVRDINKQYYAEMSKKLEDFDLYDEELDELRGDAVPMLLQAIENTYPQDIMKLDPDGKLHLEDYTKIGDNMHRLYNQEIVSRMTNELSKAGLSREDIEILVQNAEAENPGIKGALDSFYREGLGKEPKSPTTGLSPLEEAIYGVDSVENQLSKVNTAIDALDQDQREDLTLDQDEYGTITITDEDAFFDDEFVVSFGDKGRPYVNYKGKKVYLDSQEIYGAFDQAK